MASRKKTVRRPKKVAKRRKKAVGGRARTTEARFRATCSVDGALGGWVSDRGTALATALAHQRLPDNSRHIVGIEIRQRASTRVRAAVRKKTRRVRRRKKR